MYRFVKASCCCCCVAARYVDLVVEAFCILLVMCHSQSLNLFVESFLGMVQRLLESSEPDMQCLAVDSVSAVNIVLMLSISVLCSYDSFLGCMIKQLHTIL